MFVFASFLFAAAGLSITSASPLASHILQHSRPSAPAGFTPVGSVAPEQTISFRLALTASNASGLEAKLASLSNPSSPDYMQWLSADEVAAHLQPSQESFEAFNAFASTNGLQTTVGAGHGEWMTFTTNVSHANSLFAASFQHFQHQTAAEPILRTLSYSLPSALADHVGAVFPMTSFNAPPARTRAPAIPRTYARRQVPSSAQFDSTNITPACLQTMYNIPASASNASGVSILVTGYLNASPQNADIEEFLATFRPDINSAPYHLLQLDGGVDNQVASTDFNEANLDVQYAMGVAGGIPTSFLTVGNSDTHFETALFDTTTYLKTTANPPTVVTTSYGIQEELLSPQMMQNICEGYMAAGARGISIINASGDNGVHKKEDPNSCSDNKFVPEFPASCPYVTSVGATRGLPETAASFSGGGFSSVFARPAYQDTAVSGFLSTIPPTFAGQFNQANRAYPDVAFQGVDYAVIQDDSQAPDIGTSASAPAFAGLIALLNAELAAAGRPALGFLNPFLYTVAGPAGAFNDITTGSNFGFGIQDDQVCDPATSSAFGAVKGWDAVTGWGTPDFVRLLQAAQQASSTSSTASSDAPTSAPSGATSQEASQAPNDPSATSAADAGTSPSSLPSCQYASLKKLEKGNGAVITSRPSTAVLLLALAVIALFGL